MQSEHAHMNFHPSVVHEAKVFTKTHTEAVARAALKNVPGASQLIDKHFSTAAWKIPYSFAPKKVENQPYYMPY
jgi:hypothetical protein